MTIRASFYGSLGRNAETKTVGDNNKVTKFSVASNSGYGDKKITQWVDCDAWGDRYEKLAQYLVKGQAVLIYGELLINEYQSKDGTNKAAMKCRVSDIELVGSSKKDDKQESASDHQVPHNNHVSKEIDDDIPF